MKKSFVKILYKKLLNRIFNPFLGMNVKPLPLELKTEDRCLILAPHPDDESIGCGGIMALYNKNFKVICLTHGENDSIRCQEFENAMNFLNVDHEMMTLKDKHITEGEKEFEKIDIKDYDYIFIPYLFDQHKDHKAVSILLEKHLKKTLHKKNLKIAFYEVWSAMNMPNYYVDISEVVEKKKTAINFHQSQVNDKDYTNKILGLNQYRGMIKNSKAVECFTVIDAKDFIKITKEIIYEQN